MKRLEIKNLSVSLNDRLVIDTLSAPFEAGRLVGLIGPNGAGKTTLLRAIANLIPFEGAITLDDRSIADLPKQDLAKRIAYLAQGHHAHWPLEVARVVALGRLPHLPSFAKPTHRDEEIIQRAMERTDVAHFIHRTVTNLSAGERARVMLARALAVNAPILLADEPVAALDPGHQLQIMEVLQALAEDGHLVIVVTHDLTLATRFCHELIVLNKGQIVAHGPSEAVLSDDTLKAAYGVTALRGTHEGAPYVLPWQRLE